MNASPKDTPDTAAHNPPTAVPGTDPTAEWTRQYLAALARATGGLSPAPYAHAWMDWWLRLAQAPERQVELAQSVFAKTLQLWGYAAQAAAGKPLAPQAADAGETQRFKAEEWTRWPYNILAQSYLNTQQWWQEATRALPGADPAKTELARFAVEQALESVSPQNFLATNPELLKQTLEENGENLKRGLKHWLEDAQGMIDPAGVAPTEAYKVGEHLAVTPGKVIFRNRLIELIQYSPATADVYAEPVLIVPAWIMKYYILDLSPANSLVRYLVERGHTVFMVSWKNPEPADRDLAMDDYVNLGVQDALDVIGSVCPGQRVHAAGYCIGGTLLSISAAVLAQRGEERLKSMTLFAAQTDFSEPGELSLFINPEQLAMLEATMAEAGVLESRKMGAAFALLRARDLIWNPAVNTYLKGERGRTNDLMAWNADGTRMAHRMHTDYLYQLYLNNDLARGRYVAAGSPVDLGAVQVPLFVVGTETDHVAPWRSVYKIRGLVSSEDYTFLLTSGGHNAGIVSGPVHPKRTHRLLRIGLGERTLSADEFLAHTHKAAGSWWPVWAQWLAEHSTSARVAPPAMGAPADGYEVVADAPGTYVRQR